MKQLTVNTTLRVTSDILARINSISPIFATRGHFSSLNILRQSMITANTHNTPFRAFYLHVFIDLRSVR